MFVKILSFAMAAAWLTCFPHIVYAQSQNWVISLYEEQNRVLGTEFFITNNSRLTIMGVEILEDNGLPMRNFDSGIKPLFGVKPREQISFRLPPRSEPCLVTFKLVVTGKDWNQKAQEFSVKREINTCVQSEVVITD